MTLGTSAALFELMSKWNVKYTLLVDICFLNLTFMIFEKQGDSGIMMLDKQGQLCGLVVGGINGNFTKKSDLEHQVFIPVILISSLMISKN